MPMPDLDVPQFPNVPDLPGVPALLRSAAAPVLASVNALLITSGLSQFALGLAKPVWGVFDTSGNPVAVSDSVVDLDFASDSRISNYTQEAGAFNSYNKVQLPSEPRVHLACGGTIEERQAFLAAIDAAKQSTNLYNVVTPEATYLSMNVVGYGYHRDSRNGANLLIVALHLEEVRVTATAQFGQSGTGPALPASQVQNPASADPVSQGQVQALPVTSGQSVLFGPVSSVL
jgi:hypothetical protein